MDSVSIQSALGAAIRAKRESLAVSQEELAARCGLHRTYIGSVERGERNITLINLWRVSLALGVAPSGLLGEVEKSLRVGALRASSNLRARDRKGS